MDQRWSAPRVLDEGTGRPFEITYASVVPGRQGEVYIVGRGPIIESDTGLHADVPFVAIKMNLDGTTSLGKPAFSGEFATPHVGVSDTALHVFWGEPDSSARLPASRTHYRDYVSVVKGIWTSAYTNKWSSPRFVAALVDANWQLSKGWARSDWSPVVSLALVGIPSTKWTIRWLNASGASSGLPEVDIGSPLYTILISVAPEHLILGYIENDWSVPNDHNSVFAIRSTDGGRSWSVPMRIALSGQQKASDITMVQTTDGAIHALWARNTSGGAFEGQSVGYAVSRDTGRTWSMPEYWSPGSGFMNLRAVADAHNGLHVIFQGLLPDGIWPTLMYTSRTATNSWASPVKLFGDSLSVRMPEVARTASGDLLLLFGKRVGMNGKFGRWVSAVSYLRDRRLCMPSH